MNQYDIITSIDSFSLEYITKLILSAFFAIFIGIFTARCAYIYLPYKKDIKTIL